MYGYVVIGNRELTGALPQAQNLLIIQNPLPAANLSPSNLNESNDEPPSLNSLPRMSRVGYTELSNLIQMSRINMISRANLAVSAENNEAASREEGHDSITVVSNANDGARENEDGDNERNLGINEL